MRQLKIALVLSLALILQSSLGVIWRPLTYIDLPLIVVVYFALQRDALQALIIGVAAGLAADALGGPKSLLGAAGFSKTLTAYLIVSLATRVNIDNPLARIPVLAGAAFFDDTVYVLLHRMLNQPMDYRFIDRAPLKLIATTVVGTIILYMLDLFFSERARQRRQLAFRRRVARRSPLKLGRRK
jgi:rod shape-determining protein MreD